jgi:acid phosphatase class B
MSNNSNNINIINNTIFLPIPFPPFMNTLNNFGSIQYKGKAIPRINLESNNFQKNFFPTENDSNTSNQISENLNDDIEILIESNDKDYFFTSESKDKAFINSKKNFKNFSKNNNKNKNFEQNINELFSKTINNVIIPPKSFISIIEDKDEEIENNDYNNNKYNIYENINSIVINNLDKLLNDSHCFIIDNNYIMPDKTDIMENPNFYHLLIILILISII